MNRPRHKQHAAIAERAQKMNHKFRNQKAKITKMNEVGNTIMNRIKLI